MWGLVDQIKELRAENAQLRNQRDAMKKYLLAFIVGFALVSFPWRLAALGVEVLAMHPGPTRPTQSNGRFWDAMSIELRLLDLGWQVKYAASPEFNGQAAFGMTDPEHHIIVIDSALSWDMRFTVLAHEGGHVLEPGWMTRSQGEVFAETVSALASHDGLREHARYLARYKVDFVLISIMEWQGMYRAAAVLTEQ